MHMTITGEYISKSASSMYHRGFLTDIGVKYSLLDAEQKAYGILDSLIPTPAKKVKLAILNGDMRINGISVCDDKKCEQCVGKKSITITNEIDYEIKDLIEKWNGERVIAKINELDYEWKIPTNREQAVEEEKHEKKWKEINEESIRNKKYEKKIKKDLKSNAKGFVTISGFKVSMKVLEEYKLAVDFSERSAILSMYGRPQMAVNGLANRIEKHRAIFKELKVPYHGDDKKRTNPNTTKLGDAVEKWLEKNYFETSKKGRLIRMKEQNKITKLSDEWVKKTLEKKK